MTTERAVGRLQSWQEQHVQRMYETFGFTARERAVCDGLLEGKTSKEMAAEHGVSVSAISNMIFRITLRLGVVGQMQLVLVLLGRIRPQPPEEMAA